MIPDAGKLRLKKCTCVYQFFFFDDKPLTLKPDIRAGKIEDYVSPFILRTKRVVAGTAQRYAPAPWFDDFPERQRGQSHACQWHFDGALRQGGYVLALMPGIGLYCTADWIMPNITHSFQPQYGMCRRHFQLSGDEEQSFLRFAVLFSGIFRSCGDKDNFPSVTYSDVYFREPESRADQTRMMSIVTTGPETGYYVDIFRSRKERGGRQDAIISIIIWDRR